MLLPYLIYLFYYNSFGCYLIGICYSLCLMLFACIEKSFIVYLYFEWEIAVLLSMLGRLFRLMMSFYSGLVNIDQHILTGMKQSVELDIDDKVLASTIVYS